MFIEGNQTIWCVYDPMEHRGQGWCGLRGAGKVWEAIMLELSLARRVGWKGKAFQIDIKTQRHTRARVLKIASSSKRLNCIPFFAQNRVTGTEIT